MTTSPPDDDLATTIRHRRAGLHRAQEDKADLERRLPYAQEQIEALRAKVVGGVKQVVAPREGT